MAKEEYEILAGDRVCAIYKDGELDIIDEKLAPLFLQDFRAWAEARAISELRGFTSRSLKSASGISANSSAFETALKANCACVTDNYWVRETGSELTYADVNYEAYDGRLSQLALGIESDPFKYRNNIKLNPELTNIGNSDKAWVIDSDGVRWLYKRQPLRECYSEIIASKIARRLGIDTVDYELEAEDKDPETGRWGIVKSRDFTQGREVNLEHAELLLRHFGIDESEIAGNEEIFREYGCGKEYLDIIYLDIITGNPDRHSRNYGVLRSRENGAVIGLAPNYDNNFAFRADLTLISFSEVAAKTGYIPPMLTEEDIAELLEETKAFEGYNVKAALRSVEWKQRAVSNEISKQKRVKK